MYNASQINILLDKQSRFNGHLGEMIFKEIDKLSLSAYRTFEKLSSVPAEELYTPIEKGYKWGEEKVYCWFSTKYTVPDEYAGQKLYLYPEYNGYEALLFVNGIPHTNYASKRLVGSHGNHYCKAFALNPKAGETYKLDLEAYAGHNFEGNHPFCNPAVRSYDLKIGDFKVCIVDELFFKYHYDYRVLQELYDVLPENDFKKAEILRVFIKLHDVLLYDIENCSNEQLREGVEKGIEIMRPILEKHNSETAPKAGILGHSHMDTAWTWEISETIKKCARTFANQLNLMEQYPEYRFIQSSALHLKFMEEHYPELFEKISKKIAEGKYEPNGGVWVECDCNITGGEFLVRQFLWGQRYTKNHFDFTSNSFFLPDTFGYSAALPQIMKGCDVDYFLTTKIGWNETNRFPYQTYYWQGIDGTKVLNHHNVTHCGPTPKTLTNVLNGLSQKAVSDQRLVTFGHGDGGGGPEDAMLEMAARVTDLEGCPKAYYTSLTDFMVNLENSLFEPSTHRGELYLENHRGVLTNQHTIKRNNRKAEISLRTAEMLTVLDAIKNNKVASSEKTSPLVECLLKNQFHDILPGTCIPEAHDLAVKEVSEVISSADEISKQIMTKSDNDKITLFNSLSFARKDVIEIEGERFILSDKPIKQQIVEKINGEKVVHISGLKMDAFETAVFEYTDNAILEKSPFKFENNILETPFATVKFDDKGYFASFVDKRNNRELRGNSYSLNTLLFGEEVSAAWDCWNIDVDAEKKLSDCAILNSFEVVSDGAVEFRIRANYTLSQNTGMVQDIVFYADSPRIDFESKIDWNDKHRLLKTMFDTSVYGEFASFEIQYGNVKRVTNRNTSIEQCKFEVCNHKYTDISEPNYGVSILNDCKYGVSVHDSAIGLTLHKGGCKPDPRGDKGVHEFTYSFYPHIGTLSAENTIQEGYFLNYPVLSFEGENTYSAPIKVEAPNVFVETIKPCEDNCKAYIVRLYEAEGSFVNTEIEFVGAKRVCETNMLELNEKEIFGFNDKKYCFEPFKIKTFKVYY